MAQSPARMIGILAVEVAHPRLRDPVLEAKVLVAGALARQRRRRLLECDRSPVPCHQDADGVEAKAHVVGAVGCNRDNGVDAGQVLAAEDPVGGRAAPGVADLRGPLGCAGAQRRESAWNLVDGFPLRELRQASEGQCDVRPHRIEVLGIAARLAALGAEPLVEVLDLFRGGHKGRYIAKPAASPLSIGERDQQERLVVLVEGRQHVALDL